MAERMVEDVATHHLSVLIRHNEFINRFWRDVAKTYQMNDAGVMALAVKMREHFIEGIPVQAISIYHDILRAAISNADFPALARELLESVHEVTSCKS